MIWYSVGGFYYAKQETYTESSTGKLGGRWCAFSPVFMVPFKNFSLSFAFSDSNKLFCRLINLILSYISWNNWLKPHASFNSDLLLRQTCATVLNIDDSHREKMHCIWLFNKFSHRDIVLFASCRNFYGVGRIFQIFLYQKFWNFLVFYF